jgi:TonB family protein
VKISLVKQRQRSRQKTRERFSFLLLLSFLIHATLILLLALFITRRHAALAAHHDIEPPPPEVTLQLHPPDQSRPFIEAKEATGKSPGKANFESNEDTKAASELPANGSAPLPSQQGVTQTALELQNQRHTPGETPASAAGNPAPPSPQTPQTQQQQQKKADQQPNSSPTPIPSPQNTPTPQATPTTTPPRNNIKLIEPPALQNPVTSPASPQLPPPSISGSEGAKKGYQPETRQTVIQGNISNRGRSSVAADATPIGRYKKALADAIGSRWYYYVNERMGLLSVGSVTITFKVNSSGKVTDLKVVSSNSNESLTDCSIRSIMDAKFPPIPPEVAPTLQNGSLDIDFSFTIY